MRFSWSRIGATAILALFVAAAAGCTLANKIRAKNELNETARSYRDGHFDEAEQHARRALALEPTNKTAAIFIARILHQQYKPGVDTPDNIAKAKEAIEAYKQAQRLKQPVPPSEAKLAFTVKLPHSLVRRVRMFAAAKGLSISEVVSRALLALLPRGRGRG